MNLYNIYLTPFLLCLYILICDAETLSQDWLDDNVGNSIMENQYLRRKELVTSTFSPLELMKIRNSTALENWRRDNENFNEKPKRHKKYETDEDGVTRRRSRTKEMPLQKRHIYKKRNSRHKRFSRVYWNESHTTSIMRAEYGDHKSKREVNLEPYFRQSTDDYSSTRITPISAEKKPEEKEPEEEPGMKQILSAYNIVQEVTEIIDGIENLNMTIETIGRTIEYKDIILVKATECKTVQANNTGKFRAADDKYIDDDDEQPEKKIVFIVHGLSVMGIQHTPCLRRKSHFKKLVSFYFKHLDKFDIYLIPMANPDGYAYVMNNINTLWNKNVSPQNACKGVALDRNFDVSWSTETTTSSCSQQYPGGSPFSEPETRAIRDIFHRYGHKIVAYINVHSGTYSSSTMKGDAVLYPRGYTDTATDDDKYIDLRGEIDEAMKNASFEAVSVYVDTLYSWYGKVVGTSVDYASTVYGVPYALEFVMQLYVDSIPESQEKENPISDAALEEIWGRVVNTVFNNIYKSLEKASDG